MELANFFSFFYLTKSAINPGFQLKSVITLTTLYYLYQKDQGFSVLVTIAVCAFCSISLSGFSCRQIKIWFSGLLFDAVRCFLGSLRKIYASTTSTACTSILILLAVMFGFDRNLFRFAVFYYYLHGFAVSYIG